MTETATEIYCRLNNVQESKSKVKWTQQMRTDVLECKRTAQVECVCELVCVLSGFLFIEDNVSGNCFFAHFPPQYHFPGIA